MSARRLRTPYRPWLEERVLADDADFLVVDKPSGLVVHGGDDRLASDVVRRLARVLTDSGREPYLGVHQRLDTGTSGVLLFVRNRALNREVGAAFETGRVAKRYVAAVELARGSPLHEADALTLTHQLATEGDRVRVVARGGKPCRAECRVLERRDRRALLELAPETGRTHQLRVQLAATLAPVAGDRLYGGARAARLLLHAERLELPGLDRKFQAPVPALFSRFIAGHAEALGEHAELRRRLLDAASKRYPLREKTDVLRWANADGDELHGVILDDYAGYTVLSVSEPEAAERAQEIAELALELGALGVFLKRRERGDARRADVAHVAPPAPIAGEAPAAALVVREADMALGVELDRGPSTGLFVDQRENRARIRELARGLSVLNLFAYTCSFSVAAALGGAREVTSVDLSRPALERGRENFRRNGLDPAAHAFYQEDAMGFLERAARKGRRFDLVVLDPPSFSSGKRGGALSLTRDLDKLVLAAVAVLANDGHLLAVTNHRGTSTAALRRALLDAARAAGHDDARAKELPSALDCPDGPDGPSPSKSALLSLSRVERSAEGGRRGHTAQDASAKT